jgi:hypothetical protein
MSKSNRVRMGFSEWLWQETARRWAVTGRAGARIGNIRRQDHDGQQVLGNGDASARVVPAEAGFNRFNGFDSPPLAAHELFQKHRLFQNHIVMPAFAGATIVFSCAVKYLFPLGRDLYSRQPHYPRARHRRQCAFAHR